VNQASKVDNGGAGSGNFGHAGRPGQQGGSASDKASAATDAAYSAPAKTKQQMLKKHKLIKAAAKAHSAAAKAAKDGAEQKYHEDEALMLEESATRMLDRYYENRINNRFHSFVTNGDSIMTAEQKQAVINDLITNCSCTFSESDRKLMENMSDGMLDKCKKMMGKVQNTDKRNKELEAQVTNAGQQQPTGEPAKQQPQSEPQPITLNQLPVELQQMIAYGKRAMDKDKSELITRLVANVAEDKRQAKIDSLSKKSIMDLEELVELLPPVRNQATIDGILDYQYQPPQDYSGAGAGQVINRGNSGVKVEPLGIPVMDFTPVAS
jgi:hypothetical protein